MMHKYRYMTDILLSPRLLIMLSSFAGDFLNSVASIMRIHIILILRPY